MAGGGLGLEFVPGGGGKLMLALDGEGKLLAAGGALLFGQRFEVSGDPGADGTLRDA